MEGAAVTKASHISVQRRFVKAARLRAWQTVPMPAPMRYSNLAAARARFGDRVDRLAPFLTRVDPLADAVAEAIAALPPGRGFQMFSKAASHGIASMKEAPEAFRALFTEVERVPVWVDWPTIDRGGETLFRAGPLGGLVLGLKSLVLGYASPGGNKPLALSGRLREGAARRLNETARFVQATCARGGMRPFADGYQITLKVRLIHAQVRRMILRGDLWRGDLWGSPINQHDMAATTILFSLAVLEGLRQLGGRVSSDEADAYMHLWRYSGHLIGVDPELSPTSESDASRLADLITATQGRPDDDSRALTQALLAAPLETVHTEVQRRAVERRMGFSRAMGRALLGDALADELGIEQTRFSLIVPLVKRMVRGSEIVRGSVSVAEQRALVAGRRYWDRVVEMGLTGAAEFAPPTRLGGRGWG